MTPEGMAHLFAAWMTRHAGIPCSVVPSSGSYFHWYGYRAMTAPDAQDHVGFIGYGTLAESMRLHPSGIPVGVSSSVLFYERGGRLVITATPDDAYPGFEDDDDGHPHNCDAEGCGWEHVVGDGDLRRIAS